MRPKKTILCVDSNEQALSVRKFMLDTRGYRVITALTGAEALELVARGGIDLLLSDLIMPQMDGNELARRVKEIAPDLPTLLISGTVKAFDRASNADAFMPKGSSSPLELLERIRLMIARKRGPKKHTPARLVAQVDAGESVYSQEAVSQAPTSGPDVSQAEIPVLQASVRSELNLGDRDLSPSPNRNPDRASGHISSRVSGHVASRIPDRHAALSQAERLLLLDEEDDLPLHLHAGRSPAAASCHASADRSTPAIPAYATRF